LAPVLQHPEIGLRDGVYSAFALIDSYARLLFWPSHLSAFHTFHRSESLSASGVLPGIAIVLVCLLFLAFFYKKQPELAFCVLWIGLTLGPVLNVRWMAANVLTERYLYLPSVAFCWFVGRAGASLWAAWPHQPKLSAAWKALLAFACLAITFHSVGAILQRNREWRDDLTLYLTTLKTDPDAYVMHLNLGTTYFGMHDFRAAERELRIALQLKPGSPNVLNAIGCVYLEQGHLDSAGKALQESIAAKPRWTDPHFNYGRVLKKLNQDDAALEEFRTAVETGPLNASARLYLGEELADRGQYAEAEAQLKESVRLLPTLVAQQQLADLLLKTNRDVEAKALLLQTAAQYAYDGPTHLKLGRLLEKEGDLKQALREYQQTLNVDPANSEARTAIARLQTQENSRKTK
jgi:tetratricopeptide (TPR) repeat protein